MGFIGKYMVVMVQYSLYVSINGEAARFLNVIPFKINAGNFLPCQSLVMV